MVGMGTTPLREGMDPGDLQTREEEVRWLEFQKCTGFTQPRDWGNFHSGGDVRLVSRAGCQATKRKYPDSPLQLVRIHWGLLGR